MSGTAVRAVLGHSRASECTVEWVRSHAVELLHHRITHWIAI